MVSTGNLRVFEDFPEKIRIKNAAELSLSMIQSSLTDSLSEYGVPFSIRADQVQSGGLFNKQYEDCLCIVNPQHETDYFKFCIRLQKTGTMAFVYVNYYGESRLTGQKNQEDARRNSGSLAKMALGAIFKADQQALDAEYNYYEIVQDALRELFGI